MYKNVFSITVLNSITPLSKELNSFLKKKITSRHFKKGNFIVRHGEICNHLHLIRKGLVRGYFEYKDKEVTTWASVDNDIVTSISGFFKKQPALENIQCLEDTYTDCLSYDDMHFALEHFKDMNRLNRLLMEHYYLSAEYRSRMARIPNSLERYNYFIKFVNPEILNRLPKKYLASLLNIRPETLSRLHLN